MFQGPGDRDLAVKPRLRQLVVVSFIHGKPLVSLPASMQGVKSWYVSYSRGLGRFRPYIDPMGRRWKLNFSRRLGETYFP